MIAIVDYGAGNLRSVAKAIESLGHRAIVTQHPQDVLDADAVILPGVGAAADCMTSLRRLELVEPLKRIVAADRPFFAVCVGLQVLYSRSEEGDEECLDVVPGIVRKLPAGQKVPHMGWNQVCQRLDHPLFAGIPDGAHFYFVHSYAGQPEDETWVAGETDYGRRFASVVSRGNLFATQFHPEKSGAHGLKLYDNFCRRVGR